MKLTNVHPGEILDEDFLRPLGISPYRLAKDVGVSQTRVSQIIRGMRPITLDTALRFARYFGTSPEFWLNLQTHYDLEELRLGNSAKYDCIRPLRETATTV